MPIGPALPAGTDARLFPPPQLVEFQPDPAADLPRNAEVIVVGAGFVGAWAAYHLAKAGMRPLVIEANAPASGASGRLCGLALAGVGGHFARVNSLVRGSSDHSIADYTCRSLDLLEAIHDELPGGIEWERCGSLDLLTDDRQEARARAMAETQRAEGLRVEMLAPD
jgi:sarcosine oxidase subunit beta